MTAAKANQRLGFLRRSLGGSPYNLREQAYTSLVRSLLEYSGAIWDTTVEDESHRLEMVQHRAARWARGAWGIISITALLQDLNWHPLSDRRRDQRLTLFYKLLDGKTIDLDPAVLDINIHRPNQRKTHSKNLKRVSGKDTHSPLWKGTVARTITQWNALPDLTVKAGSIATFKSRLNPNPAPP